MSVAPSGILSLPIANLRVALSKSAAFQQWAQVHEELDPEAAALLKVGLVEDAEMVRPFAVVDIWEGFGAERIDSGTAYRDSGELYLMFEDNVAAEHLGSLADAQFAFLNAIGAVMESLFETDRGVFNMTSFLKAFGPAYPKKAEENSDQLFWQIGFIVRWA